MDEIFKKLDSEKSKKFYLGNFENIVNSLLLRMPNIIIEYLFKDSSYMLKKLYQNLDNHSIEYILDNIFNIISDEEEDNTCLKIIKDLLEIIKEDDNFEKAEYIFDLFFNNLRKYSGMKIIGLFLKDEKAKEILVNEITKLIEGKKNDKLLIVILNFLCELNNIIINSIIKSMDGEFDENMDFNRTMNIFKFKYSSKKTITYKYIFNDFNQNFMSYFHFLNHIYIIIAQDIKQNFSFIIQNNYNNNKTFGLKFINEYKIIVNILKLYIISFFIGDNCDFKNENLFFDQDLFLISIHLYFIYPRNNLFQNIFIDFIKLMNNEKCPAYITKALLRKKEKSYQTEFLFKLIHNLENYNLLIGTNLNILKILFYSSNIIIQKNFDNNELENIYKNIFMTTIIPKFEMELNNDYDYSFSEIFKSDSEKTFDGNDSDMPRKYDSFKEIIKRFLRKCKEAKENYKIK